MDTWVRRLALSFVVASLAAGCASGSSTAVRQPSITPSPSAGSSGPASVVARIALGTQPCAVVGGFGAVWVSLYGDDLVVRVDPRTHHVLARVHTDLAPCGLAIGAGSVWVMNYHGNSVQRIDPRTNRVSARIPVGAGPYDVTFAAGAGWVTNYSDGTVTRMDARTNKPTTIKVGSSPVGIAHAAGALWVPNQGDGTVSRIDAVTLKTSVVKVGGSPGWTAYDGNDLWVGNDAIHSVQRIDADTGTVTATISVPTTQNINDGDVSGDRIYFPDKDGNVYVLSRSANKVTGSGSTGLRNPFTLAAYEGRLWVIDYLGRDLAELDPSSLP